MRMLMDIRFPVNKFNEFVKQNTAGKNIEKILKEMKPEAVYFTEKNRKRGATIIIDVPDPSAVPRLAEPWFLLFEAEVSFHIVMSPEELAHSGIDNLGTKWS